MPVTFTVNDVNPATLKASDIKSQGPIDFLSRSDPRSKGKAPVEEFISSSFSKTESTPPSSGNPDTVLQSWPRGLVGTVIHAYLEHHHLSIRPDDVWICILGQLALYTQAHAEEMRYQFISHEGKKGLKVIRGGNRFTADWPDIVDEFGVKMREHFKDETIAEWLTPTFSTTTPTDVVAANISVMAAMSKYFEYVVKFRCGIPSITLQGTKEDWVGLRWKIDRLAELGQPELMRWHSLIIPIFDHFIRAFDGDVDVAGFWKHMVNYNSGSGTEKIHGWLGYLVPFDKRGMWDLPRVTNAERFLLDLEEQEFDALQQFWRDWCKGADLDWAAQKELSDIASGGIEVQLKVDDNGYVFDGTLVAGVLGWEWNEQLMTINPYVGWALFKRLRADEKYKQK
ncbi:hypothetical protein AX16_000105 [Volvariella volvacea WC 439]|nr:hypothetical protein AX16_000105 [Volvariella volvacea WC 439]